MPSAAAPAARSRRSPAASCSKRSTAPNECRPYSVGRSESEKSSDRRHRQEERLQRECHLAEREFSSRGCPGDGDGGEPGQEDGDRERDGVGEVDDSAARLPDRLHGIEAEPAVAGLVQERRPKTRISLAGCDSCRRSR